MPKGKKRGGQRRRSDSNDSSHDDNNAEDDSNCARNTADTTSPPLDFAARRDQRRQQAADQRRRKLKCHVCGGTGHVRRECPGILDDGRGESKYTKSKGDAGAAQLLASSNRKKSTKNNRGSKHQTSKTSTDVVNDGPVELILPSGFERGVFPGKNDDDDVDGDDNDATATATTAAEPPFEYYDTSCDMATCIDRYRGSCSSRAGRKHSQVSMTHATRDYHKAMWQAHQRSNLGGCLVRSLLKPNRPWSGAAAVQSDAVDVVVRIEEATTNGGGGGDGEDNDAPYKTRTDFVNLYRYVVGLHRDFLYNEDAQEHESTTNLLENILQKNGATDTDAKNKIVGVYCDLDYTNTTTRRAGLDRASQLARCRCTCEAAGRSSSANPLYGGSAVVFPVQLHTLPSAADALRGEKEDGGTTRTSTTMTQEEYELVMTDLFALVDEMVKEFPYIKIHLACWTGTACHMNELLQLYSDNVWVGIDGAVSFAKSKHIQECAFDVPLNRLLLDIGSFIPASTVVAVASSSKQIVCHSGLLPYVAESVAKIKPASSLGSVTAEMVARAASKNAQHVYPRLFSN